MTSLDCRKQQTGAVLFVALIMLLVLTLLAVGSMRSTTLESRITANRAHDTQLQSAADAALRESEFRYYNAGNLLEKLEPNNANCTNDNTIKASGLNKPCLIGFTNNATLVNYINDPRSQTANVAWLTYRGTDSGDTSSIGLKDNQSARFNSALLTFNCVEYGGVLEGQCTYFYLNNAQAIDSGTASSVYLQSSHANTYLGLNN
ncbi:PilX N-terminal domain-containing pilus assembly protein [Pseudomonas sp. URMO17WK12:I4]|uniref:pilus assembly PilX family protein n=1 Tax=Pseudomonas sp. URMO17WK12:I4 TaxID=1283292 RepID=UPI00047F58DB|nr:PilX N-terminal domain-containing pilus assembly protein [Pseudomonas sp. URMO17WK12:I4]